MRPQQKSFVIEIKSKGRRALAQQGSIWGTTNLKALARQAANVAPQLFETVNESDAFVADAPARSPDVAPNAHVAAAGHLVESIAENAASTALAVTFESKVVVSPNQMMSAQVVDLLGVPEHAAKPQREKRRARTIDTNRQDVAEAATDDLTSLETENARLKALWARHLRQQNEQLRIMLDRVTAMQPFTSNSNAADG